MVNPHTDYQALFSVLIVGEKAAKPKPVYLGDLLLAKLEIRKAERSSWSHAAQTNGSIRDLQKVMDFADYMQSKEILTISDLNDHLTESYEKTSAIRKSIRQMERRSKTIAGIRQASSDYQQTKEIHNQYMKIGWKSRKEKFRLEHADEISRFEKSDRFLRKNVPEGKIDFNALAKETAMLEKQLAAKNEELATVQKDLKTLKEIRHFVRELLPELMPDEQVKTPQKMSIRERLEENRRAIQESEVRRGGTNTEIPKQKEKQI